jgi:hypothetical protein
MYVHSAVTAFPNGHKFPLANARVYSSNGYAYHAAAVGFILLWESLGNLTGIIPVLLPGKFYTEGPALNS